MIQCTNCQAINGSHSTKCDQCGVDLLPVRAKSERKTLLVGGLVSLIIAIAIFVAARLIVIALNIPPEGRSLPEDLIIRGLVVASFITLFFSLMLLWRALGPTPWHEKYAIRAKRHEEIDAQQAEADYGEAIRHAPKEYRYRRERGLLYEKMGKLREAHDDFQAALSLTPKDKDARSQVESDLRRLGEKRVLELLAKGRSTAEIANEIGRSAMDVALVITELADRHGAASEADLIKRVQQEGYPAP